jgi:predicted nucleic acid-binding protein
VRSHGVKFALDPSCLVALLAEWHEHHKTAVHGYEKRLARGERLVIAGHAFLECFSVLTRLPPPLATSPETAAAILSKYLHAGELAGMTAEACRSAVQDLAARGLGGGRIYDGIIALCSYQAGATTLLTYNARHFLPVAPPGLAIVEP